MGTPVQGSQGTSDPVRCCAVPTRMLLRCSDTHWEELGEAPRACLDDVILLIRPWASRNEAVWQITWTTAGVVWDTADKFLRDVPFGTGCPGRSPLATKAAGLKAKCGNEIPLTRLFYFPEAPRPLAEINGGVRTVMGEPAELLTTVSNE